MFFFKNHAENEAESLLTDHFFNFKKALYKLKASSQHFSLNTFCRPRLGQTIKTNLKRIQTVDPEIFSILIFHKKVCDCNLGKNICRLFHILV